MCTCQLRLWLCKPCWKARWLPDLAYDMGGWLPAECGLCARAQTSKQDPRLPPATAARGLFRTWFEKGVGPQPAGCTRPVACAWCRKRVDARREEWRLRPAQIRRGEEKGKVWMAELERRKREREGSGNEDSESGGSH